MIARLWRTSLRPGREQAYEAFARERSLPMFRAQPGFSGCTMARHGGEAWVLTLWEDEAAVEALASSPLYRETVAAILAADLLAGEQTTEIAEVHLDDRPAAA